MQKNQQNTYFSSAFITFPRADAATETKSQKTQTTNKKPK